MTEAEARVWNAIRMLIRQTGEVPTQQECAQALGRSRRTGHMHRTLVSLRRAGYLEGTVDKRGIEPKSLADALRRFRSLWAARELGESVEGRYADALDAFCEP